MKKILSILVVTILLIPIMIFSAKHVNGESKELVYIQVNLWSNELRVIKNNKIYALIPFPQGLINPLLLSEPLK